MMRAVFTAACLILLLVTGTAAAQSTVFLVRHAERADGGGAAGGMNASDPDLSAAGRTRAESLATLLKDAKITTIFTSEFKRTQQTAAPLAKVLGIQAVPVPSKDSAALVKRIKSSTGNVLVVGHSNTVPELIKSLGVKEAVAIGDQEFDNLFVVFRSASPKLVRLHYH
jgi:phosphohistidine phosphatase SixA